MLHLKLAVAPPSCFFSGLALHCFFTTWAPSKHDFHFNLNFQSFSFTHLFFTLLLFIIQFALSAFLLFERMKEFNTVQPFCLNSVAVFSFNARCVHSSIHVSILQCDPTLGPRFSHSLTLHLTLQDRWSSSHIRQRHGPTFGPSLHVKLVQSS